VEIKIRHQISETQEEIYFFELENCLINYNCIYYSSRDSKDDIWGYDWSKYYSSQRDFEIGKLKELAFLDEDTDPSWLYESDYANEYRRVLDKYNPVCNKTKDGITRLTGVSGRYLWKRHTPKLTKEEIRKVIKEEINKIIDKFEIR
jgi:hypothetical protein